MKRIMGLLAGALIVALNLGAAAYVAMLTAPGRGSGDWRALLERFARMRWTFFTGAVVFFMLWMAFFWTRRRRGPRERFLNFDSDHGPVSISTLAIADFLARLANEFPSIVRIDPRVMPRRDLLDVLLNVRVRAGTQVNELCHLLQERVRQSLTEELGIPQVDNIRVNIDSIAGEHRIV